MSRLRATHLLWKLDGLAEYDVRRPLTPSGTNLLGLVKHATFVESGYLGDAFSRPSGLRLPGLGGVEPSMDMWATPEESRAEICAFAAAAPGALGAIHVLLPRSSSTSRESGSRSMRATVFAGKA